MLIADFGLSKEESLITSNSLVNGMPAYIDPQSYIRDRYKRNKKSDIFSFGMILWEISSEKEPFAGDKVEDNLNPVGRIYYAASTTVCVPASLAHNGPALGAQAGEARLRQVITSGGFKQFRRATETPFNIILEAKP